MHKKQFVTRNLNPCVLQVFMSQFDLNNFDLFDNPPPIRQTEINKTC